ncbi:hypothetical protein [Clostridium ihumii]|uniref:hypothetical protein n=1 Tax=Clostridium ihumii TaxID=1470356 RepID=UPI0005904999|nr:hypothetical protein [Clostridium ihumii]
MKKFSKSLLMLTLSLSLVVPFLGSSAVNLTKNNQTQNVCCSTSESTPIHRSLIETPPLA